MERAGAAEARERVSAQKLLILNSQYTRMLAAGVSMVAVAEVPEPSTAAGQSAHSQTASTEPAAAAV